MFFPRKELCWITKLLPAGKNPTNCATQGSTQRNRRSYGTCKGQRAEVVILGRRFTPTLIGGRVAAMKSCCSLKKHFLKEKKQPEMVMTLSWSTDLIRCCVFFGRFFVTRWLWTVNILPKFIISEFKTEICSGYKQNATLTTVSCWSKPFLYGIG